METNLVMITQHYLIKAMEGSKRQEKILVLNSKNDIKKRLSV